MKPTLNNPSVYSSKETGNEWNAGRFQEQEKGVFSATRAGYGAVSASAFLILVIAGLFYSKLNLTLAITKFNLDISEFDFTHF